MAGDLRPPPPSHSFVAGSENGTPLLQISQPLVTGDSEKSVIFPYSTVGCSFHSGVLSAPIGGSSQPLPRYNSMIIPSYSGWRRKRNRFIGGSLLNGGVAAPENVPPLFFLLKRFHHRHNRHSSPLLFPCHSPTIHTYYLYSTQPTLYYQFRGHGFLADLGGDTPHPFREEGEIDRPGRIPLQRKGSGAIPISPV